MSALSVIVAELAAEADPARAARERAYLKSSLVHLGVRIPTVSAVVKAAVPPRTDVDRVVELADALWDGVHEHRAAAIILLERSRKKLGPQHWPAAERLLRDSATWAYVDALSVHVIGSILTRHPDLHVRLDAWAADPSFWMRRAAMLALLDPLKAGDGELERFLRYSDAMLHEKEFFIRKAIGWIYREMSKRRPELVRELTDARKSRMSGLTYREATRKLPAATSQS